MTFSVFMRFTVLLFAGAAMIVGVLVMIGILELRYLPNDYRIIIGALVFLYGAYRFSISYFRKAERQ